MRLYRYLKAVLRNKNRKQIKTGSDFRFPIPTFVRYGISLRSTSDFPLFVIALVLVSFSSCVSHPQLMNFNGEDFPNNQQEIIQNATELRIQPEDLLRITVHSADPAAAQPYNLEGGGQSNNQNNVVQQAGQGGQLELFLGYFVDQGGFIDFPSLGRIKVEGLSIEQAKAKLYGLIEPFLKDAVINIRFLNFKVTILGEVNAAGTIRLTNKRVTILEAIGMAGDLSQYANRSNVLIIREKNGERIYARVSLQSPKLFTSPYFYLQQNDVIYVEPLPIRVATVADPAQRIISYSTATLSLISIIIALTR